MKNSRISQGYNVLKEDIRTESDFELEIADTEIATVESADEIKAVGRVFSHKILPEGPVICSTGPSAICKYLILLKFIILTSPF